MSNDIVYDFEEFMDFHFESFVKDDIFIQALQSKNFILHVLYK